MRVLLVVYDNDSYIHHPPIALTYIASALRNAGHEVSIYSQDLYHYPESHLADYLTHNQFDVVGLSLVAGYYPYQKLIKISQAINAVPVSKRPYYILGGHGPSPEPEYYLKVSGADCVVIGEGDITIVSLLDALEHKRDLQTVKGIAFFKNGYFIKTPPQPLIEDIDSIPFPAWDLFPMDYYALTRVGTFTKSSERIYEIISGKGCPFHCNFCYRIDEGYRAHSPDYLIEEIEHLKRGYYINFILFQDELSMSSIKRTEDVCHAFIRAKLGIKWGCNGRLNFAKPELLRLMKEAGCCFINYGIEAVDDEALRNMNKALTVKQINSGIEATLAEDIHPGFNIIWGNIGETKEVLRKDVEFLLKYDDQGQVRTIRPVTPYPGSPLYYRAIAEGKLRDCADFYENKHINQDLPSVQFTGLSNQDFSKALYEANTILLENYHKKQREYALETCRNLYLENNVSFRGFRQT